jgi:hypothetical protein
LSWPSSIPRCLRSVQFINFRLFTADVNPVSGFLVKKQLRWLPPALFDRSRLSRGVGLFLENLRIYDKKYKWNPFSTLPFYFNKNCQELIRWNEPHKIQKRQNPTLK